MLNRPLGSYEVTSSDFKSIVTEYASKSSIYLTLLVTKLVTQLTFTCLLYFYQAV